MRVVSLRVMHNDEQAKLDAITCVTVAAYVSSVAMATQRRLVASARACVGMHVYLCCGFGPRRTLTNSDGR